MTQSRPFLIAAGLAAIFFSAFAVAATQDLLTFPNAELLRGARIAAMAEQPDGKIVVVGEITTANFSAAGHIARLNADGSVDTTFSAIANAPVNLVTVSGDAVFVAGDFTTINGIARPGIAKLSMINGSPDALWNGTVSHGPNAMAADPVSGALYVAGEAMSAGGATGRIAYRLDPLTGLAGSWTVQVATPAQTGMSLLVADGALWMGTVESGAGLSRVFKLDLASGFPVGGYNTATFWPGQDNGPNFLAHDGSGALYAGSREESTPAGRTLARIDAIGGFVSWTSTNAPPVTALAADTSTLYVGRADLTRDRARYTLDQRSTFNGSLSTRLYADQPLEGAIRAIRLRGANLLLAGEFRRIDGQPRMGMAEVTSFGNASSFAPQLFQAGIARAIARLTGGDFLIGGEIDRAGNNAVDNLVYMNSAGNSLSAAPVGANGSVRELRVLGGFIYVGGYFTKMGAVARRGAARLNATSASLDNNWAPQVDGAVRRFASDGTSIYLGGDFLNVGQSNLDGEGLPIGGTSRVCLAKVDATFGTLVGGWSPAISAAQPCVRTMEFANGKLYVAANAASNLLSAGSPHSVVRLAASNAASDAFSVDANGDVNVMHLAGNSLHVAGAFTTTAVALRMFTIDVTTDVVGNFLRPAASAPAEVTAIASDATHLYLGGIDAAGTPVLRRYRFAGYQEDEAFAPVLGPIESFGKSVLGLAATADNRVMAAGGFTSAGASTRRGIAGFDSTPSAVLVLQPGAGGTITVSPGGFSCTGPFACSRSFRTSTPLVLTATPLAGQVFVGWAGCPAPNANVCTVTPSSVTAVTATFGVQTYSLALNVVGPGAVTGPGGINCPGVCQATIATGTSVTLTAVPGANAQLTGWAGTPGCPFSSNTCTFTITGNMNPTVTFETIPNLSFLFRYEQQEDTAFFGYVNVGALPLAAVEVILSNFGTTTASTAPIVLPSSWYFYYNNCGTSLPAGSYCTAQIRFGPNSAGFKEGFASVGSSTSLRLRLRGYGLAPGTAIPVMRHFFSYVPQGPQRPVDFGSARVGIGAYNRAVYVYNAGNTPFTVTSIGNLSPPFAVTHDCTSVAAEQGCTVNLSFTPPGAGDFSGILSVLTTAGNITVPVRGRGELASLRGAVDPTFYGAQAARLYNLLGRGRTYANRIAVRSDGSFVMGGTGTIGGGLESASFLYRMNAGGNEDPTFGGNFGYTGRAPLDPYPGRASDQLGDIAVLADDRILVSSITPGAGTVVDAHVRRVKSDGVIDTTFGTGGSTLIANGGGSSMVVLSDGRIVVAGRSGGTISISRLTSAGALDATFGTAGQLFVAANAWAGGRVEMRKLSDESFIVAFNYEAAPGNLDVGILKVTPSGTLDAAFGTAGRANVALSTRDEFFRDLVLRSDGRIVLGLTASRAAQPQIHDFQVVQLTAGGAPDPLFGTAGVTTVTFGALDATLAAIEAIPGGGLVLAGSVGVDAIDSNMATAVLTVNGAIDTRWGNGGTLITPLTENRELPLDIARTPDGRILLVGENAVVGPNTGGISSSILMTRLEAPDTSTPPPTTQPGGPDFNADGKSDLVFMDAPGNIAAWTMNGTGVFDASGLLPAGSGWSVTHTADFNGDGKTDILLRHTDGRVLMWIMNGLSVAAQVALQSAGSGWSVTHAADMNGDGKADLVWEHTDGTIFAWLMDGGTFLGAVQLQPPGSGWHIAHMADLSGDHKADILWQHADGATVAWLMDGLTYLSSAGFTPAGSGWSITHTGDVNGDGKADLVFRKSDGAIMLWVMDGTNLLSFAALQNAGTPWRIDLVGDLDGDGKADLIWRNTSDGSTYATLMNGTATLSAGYLMGGASGWTATHLRDLNGDGKRDIIWRYTDGTLATWIMNGLQPIDAAGLIGPSTWQVVPPAP